VFLLSFFYQPIIATKPACHCVPSITQGPSPVRSLQNSCAFERRTSHSIQGATILEIGIALPSQSVHVWHLSNIIIMSVVSSRKSTYRWVGHKQAVVKDRGKYGILIILHSDYISCNLSPSNRANRTQVFRLRLGLVNRLSSKSCMVSKGVIGITP
jgi:hypothetical protein